MESSKRKDPSSSANSEQVVVSHWDWDVVVDFKKKTLRCTATLEISTLCEGVGSLVSECSRANSNIIYVHRCQHM